MGTKKKFLFVVICVIAFIVNLNASNDFKVFNSIELKGIKILSKYYIAMKAGMKTNDKKIAVSLTRLKNVLDKESLIKSYKLIDKNSRLVIIVIENEPVFTLAIKKQNVTHLCELDRNLKILSVGRVYNENSPTIIVSSEDLSGRNLSERLKEKLELLLKVRKNIPVWNEIKQIDLGNYKKIRIKLKSRETLFYVMPNIENFKKLNALVGYLDEVRHYPQELVLNRDFVIID